ncbi:MAG: peptidoglycan -binding protein [Planktomarina sp.]|nr:peptidoglycan -binding protein [Planktomarina sp.]
MALSRRTGVRFQASIWPGFVDAMTGLLLVLMFVLTIFMVMQFVLQETIKGQGTELEELSLDITKKNDQLSDLSGQILALGEALGLERASAADLRKKVAALDASLVRSQASGRSRLALISTLTAERDARVSELENANTKIADFELRISKLLVLQQEAKGKISDFELQVMRLKDQSLEAEAEISFFNTQVAVLLAQNSKAKDEITNFETKVSSLLEQQIDADRKISEFEAQLALLVAQSMEDKRLIKSTNAEVASLENENLKNKNKIGDFELRVRELLEQKAELQEKSIKSGEERASLQQSLLAAQATIKANLEKIELGKKQAELLDEMIADLKREAQIKNTNLSDTLALLTTQQDQASALASVNKELQKESERLNEQFNAAQLEAAAAEILRKKLSNTEVALSEKEIERLAEVAAAEQLRRNLAKSQAALSSLTLQLNEQRKQAEETLTILAAAKNIEQNISDEEITDAEKRSALMTIAQTELLTIEEISIEAQRQMTLLSLEVAELRAQIGGLKSILGDFRRRDEANKVEITNLGSELNVALAQVASEERKNRLLQEAESERLLKEKERLALAAKTLEQYKSEFFGRMRILLEGREGVSIVGDRFVFSSEVLFASGRADLTAEGQNEISKITEVLKGIVSEMPSDIDWILQVDGHTDDLAVTGGIEFRNNWELSQARALSVVLFMVNAKGMDPRRLSANGFGEFQPLNKDNTSAARAQNRRIELKLTGK